MRSPRSGSTKKRQAPRWMRRSGLEWSFPLATEPRRLWRRYLVNNPLFLWKILEQALGWRRYTIDAEPPATPHARLGSVRARQDTP